MPSLKSDINVTVRVGSKTLSIGGVLLPNGRYAIKHGRRPMNMHSERLSSWHKGTCGICSKETEVTEPRDFGYLYA